MFTIRNMLLLIGSSLLATAITFLLVEVSSFPDYIGFFVSALIAGLAVIILLPGKVTVSPDAAAAAPVDLNRETGTVKWFDGTKGYGFIHRDAGDDIFVHFRSIRGNGYRSLHEGQSVEFSVVTSDKGPQAEDIMVLDQK